MSSLRAEPIYGEEKGRKEPLFKTTNDHSLISLLGEVYPFSPVWNIFEKTYCDRPGLGASPVPIPRHGLKGENRFYLLRNGNRMWVLEVWALLHRNPFHPPSQSSVKVYHKRLAFARRGWGDGKGRIPCLCLCGYWEEAAMGGSSRYVNHSVQEVGEISHTGLLRGIGRFLGFPE